ncbi:hypothetical protein L6452_09481 [Arctium lappa]|uniref:Uncharacterized protein n=1 Tax=Arctium lappa TaxID=4217 RepID=A0ACB9DK54_ARCLA|nr:hypothetical protein L6452_09481 [Arctium lappa]
MLPISTAPNGGSRTARSLLRGGGNRQLHKTLNNIKITILCDLVTILVLRGTIGFGALVSDNDTVKDGVSDQARCGGESDGKNWIGRAGNTSESEISRLPEPFYHEKFQRTN